MSDPSDREDLETPGKPNQAVTIAAGLGCILLFLGILALAYLPSRPAEPLARTAEERWRIRNEAESRDKAEWHTLAIRDAENGVYKIPLERSMELTVREYEQRQLEP